LLSQRSRKATRIVRVRLVAAGDRAESAVDVVAASFAVTRRLNQYGPRFKTDHTLEKRSSAQEESTRQAQDGIASSVIFDQDEARALKDFLSVTPILGLVKIRRGKLIAHEAWYGPNNSPCFASGVAKTI
jgi:hypothetical protein